jgi:hypothetical protein
MPIINSFADVVLDWEGLLTGAQENLELLPSVESHRLALEQHLQLTKTVKARQEAHTAGRQEATQELRELLVRGRELAIRFRNVVRADLGPKSERLVRFGISPLRKRTRRSTPADGKPETPPAAPPSDVPPTSNP